MRKIQQESLFIFIYLYLPFSFDGPTGQTARPTVMRDTSVDAESRKEVPFGVSMIHDPI